MKQLRRTIRKILLENESHEDKLIEMIATGDAANVIQALELADAIGLIEIIKFKDLVPQGHPWATHSYTFTCTTKSFLADIAVLAPKVSNGFYSKKSDILLSVYRNDECHVFVSQK